MGIVTTVSDQMLKVPIAYKYLVDYSTYLESQYLHLDSIIACITTRVIIRVLSRCIYTYTYSLGPKIIGIYYVPASSLSKHHPETQGSRQNNGQMSLLEYDYHMAKSFTIQPNSIHIYVVFTDC